MRTLLTRQPEGNYTFVHEGVEIVNPAMASRGQINPEHYGFELIDTGGGCTAWCREFRLESGLNVYMLLTQDCSHLIDIELPVEVGVYRELEDDSDAIFALWDVNQNNKLGYIVTYEE